jgi:hypothetical protein
MDRLVQTHLEIDGIIAEPVRRLALAGGTREMLALTDARGQVAFFDEMARGQVRAIRTRKADGSYYPAMRADFDLYLRERRKWRAIAASLQTVVEAQLAARSSAETAAA